MSAPNIASFRSRSTLIFSLAVLAVLSLAFVWRGAARMLQMQTQSASNAQLAQLKTDDPVKVVMEISDASPGRFRGKLLEKRDETHYSRTNKLVDAAWDSQTALVMGKAEDVRSGAVLHVTGKLTADRTVKASQIVILTGYVHVK